MGTTRRQTRASSSREQVPAIYRQMLSDADVRPHVESPERPLKRRRRAEGNAVSATRQSPPPPPEASTDTKRWQEEEGGDEEEDDGLQFEDVGIPVPTAQTIYRDSDDDDDDDDDADLLFENIDFSFPDLAAGVDQPAEAPREIQLDLSSHTSQHQSKAIDRRKPINKTEKDRRVEVHKTHLLCLLSHVARRNRWCNDGTVHRSLRKLLTREIVKYLNPGQELSQFGQTNSLKTGLQKLETIFRLKYEIIERGLHRALWADDEDHLLNYQIPKDAESTLEKSDFLEVARTLKGSRDVGAQLYCALLRSAGVEARLVCSLQVLSFTSGGPSMSKAPKSKQKLSLEEQYARRPKYDTSFDSPALSPSTPIRRRLGHPNAAAYNVPSDNSLVLSPSSQATPKKIRESIFPVYWVEVLDVGHQKWQPVDPIVTQTMWKPNVFEPPASERENCMAYVVGFEADGTVKDVTRRYVKAYNAKTRKMRLESAVANGERWWKKALKAFGREYTTDLDQIENNELKAAEEREPMPRNVADFKDHPIYALERHLRRHEVLIPGATASGTVGAGSKGPLERIYRRRDVRIARTREKWYRLGREVSGDQAAVKFLPKPARRRSNHFDDEDNAGDDDAAGTPLFTVDQTTVYKAPPIVNGVIPKNRYGNLDVFVPSMVPEGGTYISDELGTHAAFILGIDYAPALTGFHFKGRKGTAVLHGVVVAVEHKEAVLAIIQGLRDLAADMEQERRSKEVLRTWKRFLMNLRIRQRIWEGVDEEGEGEEGNRQKESVALAIEQEADAANGSEDGSDEEFAGGFIVDDDDYGGGFC
ncbi:hypothetical protein BX600DRAFT_380276 [Xylariales sp. PMI_506]|nr:hypothetical protein BX600DRAFT_380276 [Xylariales sp. PMI_506]